MESTGPWRSWWRRTNNWIQDIDQHNSDVLAGPSGTFAEFANFCPVLIAVVSLVRERQMSEQFYLFGYEQ
jgi:hypothetical protein